MYQVSLVHRFRALLDVFHSQINIITQPLTHFSLSRPLFPHPRHTHLTLSQTPTSLFKPLNTLYPLKYS